MRLLVQAGVSPQQQKMYENLAKTGHAAQAQAYLIDLLKEKYQGLAKAAFDADPTAQLAEGWKQVKESIGEFLEKGLIAIMPYIKQFMEGVKETVKWVEKNWQMIKRVGENLLTLIAVWKTYKIIVEGVKAAQILLNEAMMLNPIGAIVASIGLAITAYENYKNAVDDANDALQKSVAQSNLDYFKDEIKYVDTLAKSYEDLGMARGFAQNKALNVNLSETQKALEEANVNLAAAQKAIDNEHWYNKLSAAGRQANEEDNSDLVFWQNRVRKLQTELNSMGDKSNFFKDLKKKPISIIKPTDNPLGLDNASDKVSGTKQVIINVSINKLVETIKIEAQNIKDGVNSAGSDVARALLDAVNQFSASTDI